MFGFSKKNTPPQNQPPTNIPLKKDLVAEDFPIRTMKKDLENASNPNYIANFNYTVPAPAATKPAIKTIEAEKPKQEQPEIIINKQKTSPFLSPKIDKVVPEKQEPVNITVPEKQEPENAKERTSVFFSQQGPVATPTVTYGNKLPQEKKEDIASPIQATINISPKKEKAGSPWTKVMVAIIVILVLLASVFGAYRFWMKRQSALENPNPSQTPVNTPSVPAIPNPSTTSLSADKPNYLSIDMETADKDKIKETISDFAKKIPDLQISTPVEFLVTDDQNNPISFGKFASAYGLALNPDIMNNLGDKFSLFLYNDTGKVRLGLAVDSKDIAEINLKKALTQGEPDMAKNVEPLFLSTEYTLENKAFATSYYNGAEIRYENITFPEDLSVDYTIFRDKLIIGTTRLTLRSIIDSYAKTADTASTSQTNSKAATTNSVKPAANAKSLHAISNNTGSNVANSNNANSTINTDTSSATSNTQTGSQRHQ